MANKLKPKLLSPGDLVGVIAPASAVSQEKLDKGIGELENRGYRTRVVLSPTKNFGIPNSHFASDNAENRARAFNELVSDPEVRALFCARGGFGSQELLPLLDFKAIVSARKPLVGFSDLTALLAAVTFSGSLPAGLVTVHGACVGVEFADSGAGNDSQQSVDALLNLLAQEAQHSWSFKELRAPLPGSVKEGEIIAGNLTMLVGLLGTPWDFDYSGKFLLLEEINEAPYRVHRMLTQLKLAGKLESLAGLIFGRFSRCEAVNSVSIDDYLKESVGLIFSSTSFPIGMSLSFGHEGLNLPLPLGCRAAWRGQELVLTESPVEAA